MKTTIDLSPEDIASQVNEVLHWRRTLRRDGVD